jgi:hypothetical protein
MLSWAVVTARADSGAFTARLWEHGSGACVQVIDDVGNADDLVYEFAAHRIATSARPTQYYAEVCIERSDSFLTSRLVSADRIPRNSAFSPTDQPCIQSRLVGIYSVGASNSGLLFLTLPTSRRLAMPSSPLLEMV